MVLHNDSSGYFGGEPLEHCENDEDKHVGGCPPGCPLCDEECHAESGAAEQHASGEVLGEGVFADHGLIVSSGGYLFYAPGRYRG